MAQPDEPPPCLAVTVLREGDQAHVGVRGELDIATAPALREQLAGLVGRTADIEIDLAELDFIDCCGFGVLVGAARHQRERGTFALRSPSALAQRVIRLLGLDEILPVREGGDQPSPADPDDDRPTGMSG